MATRHPRRCTRPACRLPAAGRPSPGPSCATQPTPPLPQLTHPLSHLPTYPPTIHPQVYDVLNADKIVVEQSALAYINEWFGGAEA